MDSMRDSRPYPPVPRAIDLQAWSVRRPDPHTVEPSHRPSGTAPKAAWLRTRDDRRSKLVAQAGSHLKPAKRRAKYRSMRIVSAIALQEHQRQMLLDAAPGSELVDRQCVSNAEILELVRGGCDVLLTFLVPEELLQ